MKKYSRVLVFILVMLLVMASIPVMAAKKGNDMPSGGHFNLNIVGAKFDKKVNFNNDELQAVIDKSNGRVIFVDLLGVTKILLEEGDFKVIDRNGTDGTAKFSLPDPYVIDNDMSEYSVYVRALGKPGGKADITLEYDLFEEASGWLEAGTVHVERKKGKPHAMNVTKELLFVYIDGQRYDIFDEIFEGVLWSYENAGLKLLQMRFYEVPTYIPPTE